MTILLLQKPHKKSKHRLLILERRLNHWNKGDIQSLLEGRFIQKHLLHVPFYHDKAHTAHVFSKLMLQGKVQTALRYLAQHTEGRLLKPDDMIPEPERDGTIHSRSTLDIHLEKHPVGKIAPEFTLLNDRSSPSRRCVNLHEGVANHFIPNNLQTANA